jgi:hypothetical protein
MLQAARRRITSAHVMAGLALFISIGGGAYAATNLPNNSVGTKQIKNNAVTRAKLAGKAVGAGQLDVSSLNGLVKGNGQLQSRTGTLPANNSFMTNPPVVLASVPGFGQVQLLLCGSKAASYKSYVRFISFNSAKSFLGIGQGWGHGEPPGSPTPATVDGSGGDLSGGGGTLISVTAPSTATAMDATFEIQFSRGSSSLPTGSHTSVALFDDGASCRASAQTIIQK